MNIPELHVSALRLITNGVVSGIKDPPPKIFDRLWKFSIWIHG